MSNSDRWPSTWTAYAIISLTLLAPILGGSTEFWAKATLLVLTGILFVVAPPWRRLSAGLNSVFIGLALLPLIGFLPARFFPQPEWRTHLASLGVALPPTWSPQPWLTLEAACLFWFGLAWAYYLFTYQWRAASRERIWDVFCVGTLCLAATLVIAYTFKVRIPFWPNVPEFGFFPNRNQTSNVLGVAGILIYANAFQAIQRGRKHGWVWLVGLGVICWALILNYSRGGIVLFFVGTFVWHAWWLITAKEHARTKTMAWLPLVVLGAILILAGGETLVRFSHGTAGLLSKEQNARIPIQHDAFQLWLKSPLLGIGLGNFRSIFGASRQYFITSSQAIHPESDWLWSAVEMGALATVFLLIGLILWVRDCFPFTTGTWARMRFAALLCGIAFALHGIFDVSGHRVGALWPALFLAGSAINPGTVRVRSARVRGAFRTVGVIFLIIGSCWFAVIAGQNALPVAADVERMKKEAGRLISAEDYEGAIVAATKGLTIAPLDWELYHLRGVCEAGAVKPRQEIERDFAAARFLLPNWPNLWLKEGEVWLELGEPELAFATWQEGMKRWPDNAPDLYGQIFPIIQGEADLRDRWRQLGESDPRCLPTLFGLVNRGEFDIELERVLLEDPELSKLTLQEKRAIFSAWYRVGDRLDLVRSMREHPAWEDAAWREVARACADLGDYRQAYDLASRHVPPISLPAPASSEAMKSLAARFRLGQTNEQEGLILAVTQDANNQTAEALETLQRLQAGPHPSPAVFFLESQLRAKQKEWQKSWEAFSRSAEDSK